MAIDEKVSEKKTFGQKIKGGFKRIVAYTAAAYLIGVGVSYNIKNTNLLEEENALLKKQVDMCDQKDTKEYETLSLKIKQVTDDGKTWNIMWDHSLGWPVPLVKGAYESGKKLF